MALLPVKVALGNHGTATTGQLTADLGAALAAAEDVYALNCAVCHGATGGGLVEARLAFPADHRNCSRCHKQGNPVVMPLSQPIKDNDMFPIGEPPALHADAVSTDAGSAQQPLATVAAPEALFYYIRATMPRYHPGKLTDAEYWLLSAHLLHMNGRDDQAASAVAAAMESGWPPNQR